MIATTIAIRDLRPGDWPEVSRIYAEGIATRNATFETEVPSWDDWDAAHLAGHRLVAVAEGELVGWIALVPVSKRECYRGVAESAPTSPRKYAARASAPRCSPG